VNGKSATSLGLAVVAALSGACGGGDSSGGGRGVAGTPPFWTTVHPVPTAENLRAVRFANALQGIVAGENTAIFRTDDGGLTWFQQEHVPQAESGHIAAMDAKSLTLHAVGADLAGVGKVWNTTNSVNWTVLNTPAPGPPFTAVDIFTPDSGATPAVVYYLRADGSFLGYDGAWSGPFPTGLGGAGHAIDIIGLTGIGYAAGANGAGTGSDLRRTDDFGATWGAQTLTANRLGVLRDLSMGAFNAGYACGENSTLLSTVDGATWNDADPSDILPPGILLRGIHFPVDSANGWVVGNAGNVWRTTNGGTTWTQQAVGVTPEHLYDVWFVDTSTGYAVGDRGVVLKTSNGGTLWTNLTKGKRAQLNAVDFTSDGQRGLAVGSVLGGTGIILRSVDAGATWNEYAPTPPVQDYFGVSIPKNGSRNVAYVCGTNGTILRNPDFAGAGTWTAMTSGAGANTLRAVLFPDDDDHGVCVGDASTIVYIDDATTNLTWTAATTVPAAGYRALSHVRDSLNNIRVYAGGTGGVVAGSPFPTSTTWAAVAPALAGTLTVNALQSGFDPTAPGGPADVLYAGCAAPAPGVHKKFVGPGAWALTPAPAGATAPNGLAFATPLFGWWVSNGVYTTENGGTSWQPSPDHTQFTLRGIWMSAAGLLGAAVGDQGVIQVTASGGKPVP